MKDFFPLIHETIQCDTKHGANDENWLFRPGKYLYEYTRKHWKKLWMRFSMRLFLTICCRSMWKSSQNSFWLLFIMVLKNKHVSKQRFCFLRTSLSTSSWGRFKITRDNEATQNLQTLSISVKFCKKKCMRTNFGNIFVNFRWVLLRKDQK